MKARRAGWALAVVFAGALVGAPGCVPQYVSFLKTDDSYTPHQAAARPATYIDRLPPRPYRSVGIIEVDVPQHFSLETMIKWAADKGQEIGCDVVVDRMIHRVEGRERHLRRWVVAVEPPLRRRADPEPAAPLASPALLAAKQPAPQPVVVVNEADPPHQRREFICGVYTESQQPAPPAVTSP
jgi:hypothetical protein